MKSVVAVLVGLFGATSVNAAPPRVVADIAPIHSLVAQVMDGIGTPELLIPTIASPHGYSLKPSQARSLSNADIVVWVGESLTPWLEKALPSLASEASHLELLDIEGLSLLPSNRKDDEHAEADQDHKHEHGNVDPHIWLDPTNAIVIVNAVAQKLAQEDRSNAEAYLRNAAQAIRQLDDLSKSTDASMAPLKGKRYIVQHDGYRYFEERFGLGPAIPISDGHAAKAGARRLSDIRKAAKELNARCIFGEAQLETKTIASISQSTGIRAEALDPMGANVEPGPALYASVIETQSRKMIDCLR